MIHTAKDQHCYMLENYCMTSENASTLQESGHVRVYVHMSGAHTSTRRSAHQSHVRIHGEEPRRIRAMW